VQLTWSLLLLLVAGFAFVVFWLDTLGARESANEAARETCVATGGQLLDGTVAFRSLRIVRGDDGRPAFQRSYVFDYSHDGHTRHQGFVVVVGRRVESVGLD
jgi:hypothetical protein